MPSFLMNEIEVNVMLFSTIQEGRYLIILSIHGDSNYFLQIHNPQQYVKISYHCS